MRVELDNRCESCPDNCAYADVDTTTDTIYQGFGTPAFTLIKVECVHNDVCMFKRDNPHTQGV